MRPASILSVCVLAGAVLALGACSRQPAAPMAEAAPAPASEDRLARGQYLVGIMDCAGCHAPGALTGQAKPGGPLSGSREGFEIPGFGVVYPPNLTPHEAGLGTWSEAEIITAVRTGVRPDGRVLAPIMPWRAYAHLTDADAAAIAVYLKAQPAVEHRVPGPTPPQSAKNPYLTMKAPAG